MDTATPMSIPSMPNPATLPHPSTPWMMSPGVFQRAQSITTNEPYKKCEITSNDPEWAFVQSYFATHPPENRHIGKVYCIHNGASTRQFEALIPSLEEEAKYAAFTPKWNQEKECKLRQRVIDRWKGATDFYSPIVLQGSNQRKDNYTNVKILPLWHGTTAAICDSVCKTGFTSFGKHALIQGSNTPDQNTDIGYFGSGIYFTNSARYAADIYSDGHLLLAWVSMREPYPVVANCEYPNKPKDMEKLEGLGHFENYNAHYIPVISVDPTNKKCAVYYPCTVHQDATLDEIVVFQKTQALTRFWIELEVTLAKSPFPSTETIGTLLDKILEFLDNPEVQQNPGLATLLETKSNILFSINATNLLDPENLAFYQKITRLMDATGKVRPIVAKQLVAPQVATPLLPLQHQPTPTLPTVRQLPLSNAGREKALIKASNDGDIEYVRQLIMLETSVNPINFKGETPLILAAEKGHTQIAKMLVDNGAHLDTERNESYYPPKGMNDIEIAKTAVEIATHKDHTEIVRILVSEGAKLTRPYYNGLLYSAALIEATRRGNTDLVILFIENGVNLSTPLKGITSSCDETIGDYILFAALGNKQLEIVRWLLPFYETNPLLKFNRVYYSGDYTQTVGQWAVCLAGCCGDLGILQLLLKMKAADLTEPYGDQRSYQQRLGDSILENLRNTGGLQSEMALFLLSRGFKTRFM